MKQKKTNRVTLLLHWAGEQKIWLFLAVLLAMAGGLCIVVPYIEIYRLMDAAFGGTCTEELVVRVVAAVAAAVVLRFVLFGASGVVSHKGAYGALFKVRCMVSYWPSSIGGLPCAYLSQSRLRFSLSGLAGTTKRNCLKSRLTQSWLPLAKYRNTWKV